MTFNFGETFNINGANGDKSGLTFFNDTFWINKPSTPTPGWKDVTVTGEDTLNLPNAKADGLNYLKAYGKCYQGNLPYGFTQLESISGITNKSWIDTGIAGNNNNLRFVFTGYKGTGVAYTSFFANYVDESSNVTRLIAVTASSGIIAEVNRKSASSVATNSTNYLVAHTYELYKENGVSILKVDGVQVDTMTNSSGTANSTNIAINASKTNPSAPSSDVMTTFQGTFQIYDGTTLIRNYVMAKRDSDNAVGMYDTVNNTFKISEGTENFTAGADLKPLPTYPLAITCNNGTIKVRSKSGLPDGYVKLKYLESSGTQYLELGVNDSNPNLEIETTFSDIGGSGYRYIIGCWSNDSYQNTVVYINSNSQIGAWVCHSYVSNAMVTSDVTEKHTVKVNKNAYYLDGNLIISLTPSGIERTGAELYAFKRNGADGISPQATSISGKIYNISFKDNGVLIRNFIPARRNSDNELGMYDLVNNTFLTNAGTGTFTGGGIDEDDIEIYIDGTTETIEIHGKNLFDINNLNYIAGYITTNGNKIATSDKTDTFYIECKPNTTYTLQRDKVKTSGQVFRFASYSEVPTYNNQFTGMVGGLIDDLTLTITTGANDKYLAFSMGNVLHTDTEYINKIQIEQGSTATAYEPYFNGGSATAENLLSAGTYKDVQSILDGTVTRNIGVKVLTGDETWTANSASTGSCSYLYWSLLKSDIGTDSNVLPQQSTNCLCTHYPNIAYVGGGRTNEIVVGASYINFITRAEYSTVDDWKAFLQSQCANGTPVILIYPLATATTETVTAQTLRTKRGDNTIEITQASLGDLTLEAQYQAGVTVTIEEVEEANLDNNVTVVIGE